MKVKEIMTVDVKSLSPDDNAQEALNLLQKMKISGLPVIDESRKLVGMFTEKEVLSVILPSYLHKVGSFEYKENPKAVRTKILSLSTLKVKDVARREVVTVNDDTTLCEAARLMLSKSIRRLVVVDKDKNIVGIVSRGDVVSALFDEYRE